MSTTKCKFSAKVTLILVIVSFSNTSHFGQELNRVEDLSGKEYAVTTRASLMYRCPSDFDTLSNINTGTCMYRPSNFYQLLQGEEKEQCRAIVESLNLEFRTQVTNNRNFWVQVLLKNAYSYELARLSMPDTNISALDYFTADMNNNGTVETVYRWTAMKASVFSHSVLFEDGVVRDFVQRPLAEGEQFVREYFSRNDGKSIFNWESLPVQRQFNYDSLKKAANFDLGFMIQYSTVHKYYEPIEYEGMNYFLLTNNHPVLSFYPQVFLLRLDAEGGLSIDCQFGGNYLVLRDEDLANL